ncbi:MAG: hypothetical protein HFJ50_03685 [Clostridia bacterium]|nr:hypothetical protein [Clostridia bacterium]
MFNSRGASLEYWDRIRPIIEIPMERIIIKQEGDGMSANDEWKILKKS